MDATLERLETDLLARWGREEMTVYADYLQSIGDPRGEVVAIDLVNLDTVNPADWKAQREQAITNWIGAELAEYLGASLFQGFIQESSDARVLASPVGEFVRASRTACDRDAIERLAARPRPWLAHLAISGSPETALPNALIDKLVSATPRLDQLVLRGQNIIDRFAHPHVRHVRIEGAALATLRWGDHWLEPSPPVFAIERVRPATATSDSRLYLSSNVAFNGVEQQGAIKAHVTHLRIGGGDPFDVVWRFVLALPRLEIIETAGRGPTPDELRRAIARGSRSIAVAEIA